VKPPRKFSFALPAIDLVRGPEFVRLFARDSNLPSTFSLLPSEVRNVSVFPAKLLAATRK
jgi:hypothetical protein